MIRKILNRRYFMLIIFAAIIKLGSLSSCSLKNEEGQEATLTDEENLIYENSDPLTDIDENIYNTVKIGEQVWMTKNLNTSRFRNGDEIPEAKNYFEWRDASFWNKTPAWCYFDFNPKNGEIVGKLYNWYAITDQRGLAPEGFHIPSHEEWTILTDYIGIDYKTKLKSKSGWKKDQAGTDISGFSGLPSGFYGSVGGINDFYDRWETAVWWSTTRHDEHFYAFGLNIGEGSIYINLDNGVSVRCIKDN
jgi:uncharacterized protein (TIGR02145 family)